MTFNVISDLHINNTWSDEPGHLNEKVLDWNIFDPEKLKPADYLIIAGDIKASIRMSCGSRAITTIIVRRDR